MRLHSIPTVTGRARHRWLVASAGSALAVVMLAVGLLGQAPSPAEAQVAPVAQCNDDAASNIGGQGIACTVTVTNNFLISEGGVVTTSAPSTVTTTRCVGAAGPIREGAGTCATSTFTSATPITQVRQCNGSANGGGGVVRCTVTVTNMLGGLTMATSPATVYQCIGSVITGPGAPGSCTPVNTPGVTSVTAATVGQCNGSGNGGTNVGFVCTVGASSVVGAIVVNVDQCNGSANGGGSQTTCSASVLSQFVAQVAPLAPTPTPAPTSSATPVPTPQVTPTAVPTPSPIARVAVPLPSATVTVAGAPEGPATGGPPPTVPTPADTGSAGPLDGRTGSAAALFLGVATLALALSARRMSRSSRVH